MSVLVLYTAYKFKPCYFQCRADVSKCLCSVHIFRFTVNHVIFSAEKPVPVSRKDDNFLKH